MLPKQVLILSVAFCICKSFFVRIQRNNCAMRPVADQNLMKMNLVLVLVLIDWLGLRSRRPIVWQKRLK